MTPRERVLAALDHGKPDRTPRLLYDEVIGYVPAIKELLDERCSPLTPRRYFDMDITAVAPTVSRLSRDRFAEWFPEQAKAAAAGVRGFSRTYDTSGGLPVDEWGAWWRPGSTHHFVHVESPLNGIDDLRRIQDFPWPDIDQAYRYDGVGEAIAAVHDDGLAVTAYAGAIFEQAWYIRGMESLLVDMMVRPDIANLLMDHTAYYQRSVALAMVEAGVDFIMLGDDVGSQRGLIMSADLWRDYLKPRLAATIAGIRAARPDCKVFYHSDGDIRPIIPELIEVGVDILNPVQPECMDPREIKERYGDRLTLFGTVSVQKTMSFGTPADVRDEVRARIKVVGHNGGFILAPAHVLEPEVPWDNVEAFFGAADEERSAAGSTSRQSMEV